MQQLYSEFIRVRGSGRVFEWLESNDAVRAFTQLRSTLTKVQDWMSSNRLKLNPSKTQFIWFGIRVQIAKIDKQELIQQFPGVVFHSSVVDLCVIVDEELKMDSHVGRMVRSCFYQLRQIRTIRQSFRDNATRTLIHSFIVTRVELYCNSVLSVVAVPQSNRVQRILNAAEIPSNFESDPRQSSLVASSTMENEIQDTAVRRELHQPQGSFISARTLGSCFVRGRCRVRSAEQFCLVVPRCRSTAMQRRGFSVAGPSAWNELSTSIYVPQYVQTVTAQKLIKTHLFSRDGK